MSKVHRLLAKLAGKQARRPPVPLREALPYPVQVRRRVFAEEGIRKRGGLQVFDSPEALPLNEARMKHLESLGLDLKGKTVLDVGAGVGHLAACLEKLGCSVFCVEGRPGNVAGMRKRYPHLRGEVGNVETEPLSRFGEFDIVFSYGLLYHLENPMQSVRNMASVCKQMLLLESIICDHELPIVRNEDESTDVNQALAGLACRPSPHYVVLALNRAGFQHVYAPVTPPEHPDFRFEWKNNLDCTRDGNNMRCVFVASRAPLESPELVSLLTD